MSWSSNVIPAGLRVLVLDDDPTWLRIIEKMLKKCDYEVTTCRLAIEALNMLRERRDGFDIRISDVNMPDMDGFKLLEHVGLEMDLPVIIMSVDGETSRVMRGVHHGACDYLLKPIRMKELRNMCQHFYKKKINAVSYVQEEDNYPQERDHVLDEMKTDLLAAQSALETLPVTLTGEIEVLLKQDKVEGLRLGPSGLSHDREVLIRWKILPNYEYLRAV